MDYVIYPSYNQHCSGRSRFFIISIFLLISFSPLFADYGVLHQLKFGVLIFSPLFAYAIAVGIDYLLSRYLMPGSVKPLKITASQLFIPKWLIFNANNTPQKDEVVESNSLVRVVIQSYTVRSKHSTDDFINSICLQFYDRRIYLDGKKLMFNGVVNDDNKLMQGLKSLPCEIIFEHKNNFGDMRLLYTMVQGRWGSTYTLLTILMFVISFGSLLWLIFFY